MKKIVLLLIAAAIVYATFFTEKARLDREVDRLCAIDGGIRVYETVKLPPDKFNERGEVIFYQPTQRIEDSLGLEYIFQWDVHYYKKGDPAVTGPQDTVMKRTHIQIIRKSDMKILGEFVLYSRGGGDFPGPWAPSSYRCPSAAKASSGKLMRRIFIQLTSGVSE
ncbi:MAG: hypothetical protein HRU78_07095 [Gammaproteobacteria bacterium]|nr:MAG: hypothetical protein HRU78_07095 [Gammaproteobacteria bacterium]